MTTGLFCLRAVQTGLSIADLRLLTFGMVLDMFTERSNDNCEYSYIATQDDINKLAGRR